MKRSTKKLIRKAIIFRHKWPREYAEVRRFEAGLRRMQRKFEAA